MTADRDMPEPAFAVRPSADARHVPARGLHMYIIAEFDIRAINLQPMRADNLQPAADFVKLRHDAPLGVKAAAKINQ